jgi:ribonuclease J
MKIIFHRAHQIGGCITEIVAANGNKIIIDLGSNLPSSNQIKHEYSENDIKKLTKDSSVIFYTHYHGDHVGLAQFVPSEIPQFIGKIAKKVMQIKASYIRWKAEDKKKLDGFFEYKIGKPMPIDCFEVTPFTVNHSAGDAYMLLIKVDGKTILHTGDFRDHGYYGEKIYDIISKYINKTEIDFLITESTMFSRENEHVKTEMELADEAKCMIEHYKYCFTLTSSTDIDRIATLCSAIPGEKLIVCDNYQMKIIKAFAHYPVYKKYLSHKKFEVYNKTDDVADLFSRMKKSGFLMFVRKNDQNNGPTFIDECIAKLPKQQQLLIYSMWSGYLLKEDCVKQEYVDFRNQFLNTLYLHTSGHASIDCIEKVCKLINPRYIIPIHGEEPQKMNCFIPEFKDKTILNDFNENNVEILFN